MSSFDYLDFEGICGDSTFMDAYYYYQKSNQELQKITVEKRDKNDELLSYKAYLIAIQQCLFKINGILPEGSIKQNYLDWFRWNYILISSELDRFQSIEHLNELLSDDIRKLETEMETTFKSYFELNEEEKGVFNQYVHAYERVKRSQNRSGPVYLQSLQDAAGLFANYINYLIKRCMFTSFQDVQSEAEFLIKELRGLDDKLSSNVKNILKQFKQCRYLDKTALSAQDKIMEEAMIIAHLRANEIWLESALSKIRETIEAIKKKASEKIKECMEIGRIYRDPINLENAAKATKEILNWAKENPWKAAIICLGGVSIVVGISHFTIFVLSSAVVSSVATGVSSVAAGVATLAAGSAGSGAAGVASATVAAAAAVATSAAGFAAGAAGGGAAVATGAILAVGGLITTVSLLSIYGSVLKVREEAREKIQLKEQEIAEFKSKNDKEVRQKARQISEGTINDKKMREKLNKTRDQFLDELRVQNFFEEQARRERDNQLNNMNVDELNQKQEELVNDAVDFEDKLKDTKEQLRERHEENVKMQNDISQVQEGKAAAARLVEKFAQKCQQKPSENQQKNENSHQKEQSQEEDDDDDEIVNEGEKEDEEEF